MEEKNPLENLGKHLNHLNQCFQKCKQSSIDDVKFQNNLNAILEQLSVSKVVDNKLLISLEKFYQASSFLIGLSTLKLDERTYKAWRMYDSFHFDYIKPKLQLYGPTIVL
ncbi:MAG: helicase BlpT [Candidatus Saccharibacteria bacterium]|nr:helicase BlpT [Candidatus Saccharibacteria bacterium]